ncbi:MAG: polyamine aminopropyltransferase [Candidatus Aminicenantes bacterium]|nr:MAG: polyamine aminopropyltransferase [Candidatus Aminicenantes bacterium]
MTTERKRQKENPLEEREYHTPANGLFFTVKQRLFKQESRYQKIEVFENEYFGRVLLLDGLVQTTEKDEFFYHEMLVHPAFLVHPSSRNLLVIGGGDGGGLKEILRYPVESVCLVEIDPLVIEVCQEYFPWLSPALKDERTELVISDGMEFIQKTDRKFDIIFIDSSDPVGPSAWLHERDFFSSLKECLCEGGIIVAQAGSPFFGIDSIRKKNDFLKPLFKIVSFYMSPVPTYPGGSWAFVFLSDRVQPLKIKGSPPAGLHYFNPDIHRAAFSLPNFFKEKLD